MKSDVAQGSLCAPALDEMDSLHTQWVDGCWLDSITAALVSWAAVNEAVSARLFAKRHVVFYTTVFLMPLCSYARGQHELLGARIILSVRIADPLTRRRA